MKRRTKAEIEVAKVKEAMVNMGMDPESEEGRKKLEHVENKFKAKSYKTDPNLSKAKKKRIKAKANLMSLDRAAKTVMNLSVELYEENVEQVREAMKQANLAVKMLGGDDMQIVTEHLDEYMVIMKAREQALFDADEKLIMPDGAHFDDARP